MTVFGRAAGILAGLFLLMAAGAVQAQSVRVTSVTVEGNARIEDATVVAYSGLSVGQTLSPEQINASLRRLNATGLFESAEIQPSGGDIQILIIENPTVNRIVFEGNKLVPDDVLLDLLPFQARRALDRSRIEDSAAALLANYRSTGRFNATVVPKLIERADNRVDVVFEIFEGDVTEFSQISFLGNSVFTENELKEIIESGEAGAFSTFFSHDTFSADRLELDKQLLREAYLNKGYAEFEILSVTPEITPDRSAFTLVFALKEGPQYEFGDLSVSSQIVGMTDADFERRLPDLMGSPYAIKNVDQIVETLTGLAGEEGYAFAVVSPQVARDEAALRISVRFDIAQGERSYVERINIVGNTATLDRVIRRQFDLVEGDVFDSANIRRAVDRIRALGYFSAVEVRTAAGSSPNQAVVELEVEDQPTGNIGFGLAVSSQDGPQLTLDFSERNFLGRGQNVGLSFSSGETSRTIRVDFEEPAFLGRDLAAGFSVYSDNRDQDNSSFQETNVGFEPRLTFAASENATLTLRARISSDEIRDVGGTDTVSQVIRDDTGSADTFSVGYRYVYDRRNSKVTPTDGYIVTVSQDVAGLLGGDSNYLRSEARVRFNTAFQEETMPAYLEFAGGALVSGDSNSRITDRFFLGGDSFRGFSYAGMGPRDKDTSGATSANDALGGNFYAMMRSQLLFPIGIPEEYGMLGGVFFDMGTLWGLDKTTYNGPAARGAFTVDDGPELRSAIGVSFFWDTPIGPLRFNFAKPLMHEDGDNLEQFRFTLGGKY